MTNLQATIVDEIKSQRQDLDMFEKRTKSLLGVVDMSEGADKGEMKANIMLAFRALEDARMRLGKVIQAHDGGVSVYDKAPKS